MIYVASLYSNGIDTDIPEHLHILEKRVRYTMKRVYRLLLAGEFPYSPIVHCHQLSKEFCLPTEYEFWKSQDRNAIDHCDKVYVLKMTDKLGCYTKSVGVTDEVWYANKIGKEVIYLECEDYGWTEKLMSRLDDFTECVIETRENGKVSLECKLGLWDVSSSTTDSVYLKAFHYWQQYYEDGEYYQILGEQTCREIM